VNKELWTAVEQYVADIVAPSDTVLDAATEAGVRAGLPTIAVTPTEGKLLYMLARLVGAKRILEVGTLAGYSAIWMARALPPGGKLITLEYEAKHAEVARVNLSRAGLAEVVDVRVGAAHNTLPLLEREKAGPFDLVFIDADKKRNADYFEWAIKLSRPGAVIVVDNVIRDGEVIDANSKDPSILGVRRLNDLLRTEKRVTATTIQTVGSKGYDGFTIAIVLSS
jgi:predicted O-methyltransferase YrrM